MPGVVAVGSTARIDVLVSREMLAAPGEEVAVDEDRASVAPDVPLLVRLLPRLGFEVRGADRHRVAVPEPGEPLAVSFCVQAICASPSEVWVALSQGQLPVGVLKLRPEVVEDPASSGTVQMTTGMAAALQSAPRATSLNRLDICERVRPDEGVVYEYEVQFPALEIFERFESPPIPGDRDAYVHSLYRQLEQWTRQPGNAADLEANLRAFGGELFDELLPKALRDLLWENREALNGVMVVSTEPFIPWELLHLKPRDGRLPDETWFLAQAGLVRWRWGTAPPDRLIVRRGFSRYVIPAYGGLDATVAEREMLEERLGATAIPPDATSVRSALHEKYGFDLLHYAGHAEAQGDDFATARLLLDPPADGLEPDQLLAPIVRNFGRFGSKRHRPIIVLNACQSGRSKLQLTSLGGFAEAFLERYAGAFVGTLWLVGDKPALTFIAAFYERLQTGATFSHAAAAARESTRRTGDPSWLAYVVYAHPSARVTWAPP